jgi:hypothetical protein
MGVKLAAASGGSIELVPTNTASAFTVTVPATTAAMAIDGPAFSAYQTNGSVNQSIASDVFTKAKIDTEEFDTNSNYDTSLYRFRPTVAGYYQVNGNLYLLNAASSALKLVALYKNGSIYKSGTSLYFTGNYYAAADNFTVSSLIYLNGSTDYVELYGYISSANASIGFGSANTWFNAAMVRSA